MGTRERWKNPNVQSIKSSENSSSAKWDEKLSLQVCKIDMTMAEREIRKSLKASETSQLTPTIELDPVLCLLTAPVINQRGFGMALLMMM
jgi:hypothetical protein